MHPYPDGLGHEVNDSPRQPPRNGGNRPETSTLSGSKRLCLISGLQINSPIGERYEVQNGSTEKMVAIAAALVACMMMAGCGASANTVDISSMEFNPQGKTIKQIAAALESGETTSRQLVSYYLDRINKYDDNGPEINAITQINPHVMRQAYLSDRGRKDHAQHSIFTASHS